MPFVRGSWLWTEGLKEFGRWQGINDVLFLEPAAAGHGDPVTTEGKGGGIVGVRRDHHLDAAFLAQAAIDALPGQPAGMGGEPHGPPRPGRSRSDSFAP